MQTGFYILDDKKSEYYPCFLVGRKEDILGCAGLFGTSLLTLFRSATITI